MVFRAGLTVHCFSLQEDEDCTDPNVEYRDIAKYGIVQVAGTVYKVLVGVGYCAHLNCSAVPT